jgi:HlyD family secretion protein
MRNQDLANQFFISPSALELRTQEKISAEAAFETSRANLAGVKQDVIRLNAERAGLQQQRNNVRLIAPAHGVVTTRDAEPGTTVVAGQPVIRLIDPDSLWVKLRLDQGRSAGLKPGLPKQVRTVPPRRSSPLPSSQPVLRPTHSSSFSQGDAHGLQQAHMASMPPAYVR